MNNQLRVLFAANLGVFATGYGLLPLLPIYLLDLGGTPATTGLSMACAYLALAVGTALTGWLSEVVRSRRWLFMVSAAPSTPALILLGQAGDVRRATALACLVWFSAGITTALIGVLIGLHADPAHRGRTFGTMFLAMPLGAAIGATGTGVLAGRLGYPAMFGLLGLAWLGMPLLGALGLRDEPEAPAPAADSCAIGARGAGAEGSLALGLLLAATLLGSVAIFVGRLGTSLEMQALHFGPGAISSTVAVGALAALPVLPASGALSDRFGRRGLLIGANLLAAGGVLALVGASALWQFWLAAALLAVSVNASGVVATALATDFLPQRALTKDLPLLGAMTWVAAIVGFAGTGYLLEALGAARLYQLAAVPAVVAAGLIGLLHYERCAPPAVQGRLEGRGPWGVGRGAKGEGRVARGEGSGEAPGVRVVPATLSRPTAYAPRPTGNRGSGRLP